MNGAAVEALAAPVTDGMHAFIACTECVTRRGSEHCAICHLPRVTHTATPMGKLVRFGAIAAGMVVLVVAGAAGFFGDRLVVWGAGDER